MSKTTREINKITGAVIGIAGKLIVYAVVLILLFEGVTKGYAFGHEVFYASPMAAEPGEEKQVSIGDGMTVLDAGKLLREEGLIRNEYAFLVQAKFYEYDVHPGAYTLNTSMSSKEMLQALNETYRSEEAAEGETSP